MYKRLVLVLALLLPVIAWAKSESWVEVRSPHFTVITNSNEKQARRVADQFERMRSVFHTLFPKIAIDNLGSITVLAVKDEKDFRALEPTAYLAKGQLKLGGLFLRGPDKNYVLLRLDAEGEHPYAVVYHEYTHLLLSKAEFIPLWLNEGLAEYYENTEIREKEVALGQPSPGNLELLRENRLMPLATLFAVDHSSPYYHEENKGSIFYAESWALTHYLEQKDFRDKTQRLTIYAQSLAQNVDGLTAATRAFGDLKQLQSALEGYVRQASFQYLRMAGSTEVDDSKFEPRGLTLFQADAVRADFLAYNDRAADARALLEHILQIDPNNVLAHETMGFLEFREQHIDAARNWYAQAVKLDSQSFLAHYYFAAISMNGVMNEAEQSQVENSLRASIKLNPTFAPGYDRLGAFLAMRRDHYDEARLMALSAVQLDPANLSYRMDTANILLQMGRGSDAVNVIRNAMHLASSPQESAMAENFLMHAQEYAQFQEYKQSSTGQMGNLETPGVTSSGYVSQVDATSFSKSDEPLPTGPHRFLIGVLNNVHCTIPAMDLNLTSGQKTLALHANNYFRVEYSVLNLTLKGDLHPCTDLEGRSAKVEYVESSNKNAAAVVAIEIHK
jgi:tetratricopeptide (TPR) repeat protein